MAKTSKLKPFYVWAKATIDCSIRIEAESLADALEKSRELRDADFFNVHGDYNDGEVRVYGVMEA